MKNPVTYCGRCLAVFEVLTGRIVRDPPGGPRTIDQVLATYAFPATIWVHDRAHLYMDSHPVPIDKYRSDLSATIHGFPPPNEPQNLCPKCADSLRTWWAEGRPR